MPKALFCSNINAVLYINTFRVIRLDSKKSNTSHSYGDLYYMYSIIRS